MAQCEIRSAGRQTERQTAPALPRSACSLSGNPLYAAEFACFSNSNRLRLSVGLSGSSASRLSRLQKYTAAARRIQLKGPSFFRCGLQNLIIIQQGSAITTANCAASPSGMFSHSLCNCMYSFARRVSYANHATMRPLDSMYLYPAAICW